MTPAARAQAAITILDEILAGKPAEQALTGWARGNRYAGSGDRTAVRDHVFDVLRRRRSLAAAGGGETGRMMFLGLCRVNGLNPEDLFTGDRYAPAKLDADEIAGGRAPKSDAERFDIPDWLWPQFAESMGEEAGAAASALQSRAPVHLRVNLRKSDLASAVSDLAQDGVVCIPHPVADTALIVTEGSRRIRQSGAYQKGLVELQDAASQAVATALPLRDGMRVLDYCAGGGGKGLAIAARADVTLYAHDAAPERMRDLPERARRAGVGVQILKTLQLKQHAPFDLVLCDVPCSGSGSWRRSPEGKWRLTPERLAELQDIQASILAQAAELVGSDGFLGYSTCSVLTCENSARINVFLSENPDWASVRAQSWHVQHETDGFYLALLTRVSLSK